MVKSRSRQSQPAKPFQRKEFYALAAECRQYATDLASLDPRRVNLKECHRFNAWRARLLAYQTLGPRLASVERARPVARWQVAILAVASALVLALALAGRVDRIVSLVVFNSVVMLALFLYMTPEKLYGTTVEEIEGRVLRVVRELEAMLNEGDLQLTDAAWHQARANLESAALELRQQIDLAHRTP